MTKAELQAKYKETREHLDEAIAEARRVGELDEELASVRQNLDEQMAVCLAKDKEILGLKADIVVLHSFLERYFTSHDLKITNPDGHDESVFSEPFSNVSADEAVILCNNFMDIMLTSATIDGILNR